MMDRDDRETRKTGCKRRRNTFNGESRGRTGRTEQSGDGRLHIHSKGGP